MSSGVGKKVFIQIETTAEQEEHLKQQRKTLKVLQGVAKDKENLTGRTQIDKLSRLKAAACGDLAVSALSGDQAKRKKIDTKIAETQTTPQRNQNVDEREREQQQEQQLQPALAPNKQISIEDLTGEGAPSEQYWECLAEKRREALEKTLEENQRLHERIDGLEEELNTSRQQLEEAQHLVAILTDMLNEAESNEPTDENDEMTPEEQTEDPSLKSTLESVQDEEEAERFEDCLDVEATSENPSEKGI